MNDRLGRFICASCLAALAAGWAFGNPPSAGEPPDPLSLLSPVSASQGSRADPPKLVLPEYPKEWRTWAVGVSYIGGELRWRPSARWAFEGDYQQDKASSNYGDVTARLYGARAYRFFHERDRWSLYAGPEFAYTTATPETSSYRTKGFVGGAFMGAEMNISRRLAFDLDIGPYVISLKETQTQMTQTNLDFVVQTALLFNL